MTQNHHNITVTVSDHETSKLLGHVHKGLFTFRVYLPVVIAGISGTALSTFGSGFNWSLLVAVISLCIGAAAVRLERASGSSIEKRRISFLEQRISTEASSSRVLTAIKALTYDNSRSPDASLVHAARLATSYPSSVIFTLSDAMGVLVPSDWSHSGEFSDILDEYETLDGDSPGAVASRQGSALVLSTDDNCADLPRWAEESGFNQGIVVPITRGLDTAGVLYVLNSRPELPTLGEIEQLELLVGFQSNSSGTINHGISVSSKQSFRTKPGRSDRQRPDPTSIQIPGLQLIPELSLMDLAGASISLSPTEFLMIETLASCPGQPVSSGHLVSTCWAKNYQPAENAVDVAIFRLRRKLEKTPFGRSLIKTVRGRGYMLVPPVIGEPASVVIDQSV